jgi:hypothetical protein
MKKVSAHPHTRILGIAPVSMQSCENLGMQMCTRSGMVMKKTHEVWAASGHVRPS